MFWNVVLWLLSLAGLAAVTWTLSESCRRAKSGELEKELDQ